MIRFQRSRTVTGAAHTNWSMFGSRGPLREDEHDKSGGGSPAPAPAGDPPAPVSAPAPAPAGQQGVAFTPEQQEYINKLVGKARQEGRDAARTQAPTPPPAAPPAPAKEPAKLTLEDLANELRETKMRARFDKQALRRGYADEAADDLFELYKAQKPADDESWFAEREKRLGLKQPATPPASTQPPTPPAVPAVPNTAPISDRGSPAPAGAVGWRYELTNPIGMSAAARAQMDAELGVEKARKMRLEAARNQAANLKVKFGPS